MNISILELSILPPKNLLFLYYIQVIRFEFFEKNRSFFICFIVLFNSENVLDLMMILYLYDTQFIFSKNRESFLRRPISSFDLFLGSKLDFLVDFIKNKRG